MSRPLFLALSLAGCAEVSEAPAPCDLSPGAGETSLEALVACAETVEGIGGRRVCLFLGAELAPLGSPGVRVEQEGETFSDCEAPSGTAVSCPYGAGEKLVTPRAGATPLCSPPGLEPSCAGELLAFQDGELVATFAHPPAAPWSYELGELGALLVLGLP